MNVAAGVRAASVSVCIPARNAERYLAETIESVLAQSVAPSEVIVSDNASTDSTADICRRYAGAGVRTTRYDTLVGQAGNWNRCLELASGEYVVILHADDLLAPAFVERATALHRARPGLAFSHCGVRFIDSQSREIGIRQLYSRDTVEPGAAFVRRLLVEGCLVNPAGVMLRRCALDRVGPFAERIEWGIDWHMWMRLCAVGDVGYLSEPLSKYRLHGGSGTAKVLARGRLAADELWAARDVLASVELAGSERKQLEIASRKAVAQRSWCAAEAACEEGQRLAASRGLLASIVTDPLLLGTRRAWGVFLGVTFGPATYTWLRRKKALMQAAGKTDGGR